MKRSKYIAAVALTLILLSQLVRIGNACGPEPLQPLYGFTESPDPPFEGFVQGNLGIVQNTFGRKTLFIAYHYLQGGSFTGEEQHELVEALKGKPPEEEDDTAIKQWINARKDVVKEDALPQIYQDRRNGGFDFFPNCTRNAFEVATRTLADRLARFGAEDIGVKEWLRAQDQVFENCAGTASIPSQLGPESPTWLRQDRDYQIGAALFYQMKFAAAREQFERVADDPGSSWQQTARYLVARTLVREASLDENEKVRRGLYERAEVYLTNLLGQDSSFHNATMKLLGLVKYRLHPEERVRELAQVLESQSGNENLRQDLIDYTWLLARFDQKVREEEEKRNKTEAAATPTPNRFANEEEKRQSEAIEAGELIKLWFSPLGPDGQLDYRNSKTFVVPHDASQSALLETVEGTLGRKLSDKENSALMDTLESALEMRRWRLNPNQKWKREDYEGCFYQCKPNAFDLVPQFLRLDDLTDWIFTLKSEDPKSFRYASARWKDSHSVVWLIAALSHAEATTPGVQRLINQAENFKPDSPAFATLAYQRVRLAIASHKSLEAKSLLDQIINTQFDSLPVSTQNKFLEQRMSLSESLTDFLRYSARKPVTFYQYGTMGSISQILDSRKEMWGPEYENKAEFEQEMEATARELLPWQDRTVFDDKTAEMIAWHFSTAELFKASRDAGLPDYLRGQLALTVWTRSVLLNDEALALKVTPDLISKFPEMADVLRVFLEAKTGQQRSNAALFALLRFPHLTPFVVTGVPEFGKEEDSDYYFETAWWCPLSNVDYDDDGNEVAKTVSSPQFLTAAMLSVAARERRTLNEIGSAKSFLGRRVLEWSRQSPDDPRIPEALFIALKANEGYKYGCESWERDEQILAEADSLLHERYSGSVWTTKLDESRK